MIRTAWPHDLPALRALFAAANDGPYDLPAVAEEKCFGRGVAGPPVARVYESRGVIEGAAVSCGRWLRLLVVARESRRRGIGTALLRDAEERGIRVIGAEPGNYFTPGIVTTDAASAAFFRGHGYIETRWTSNLDAPLQEVGERLAALAPSAARRPRHEEADRVLDFIEREFGRIWRFEASLAFAADLPTMMIAERDGQVVGFAAHDVNNRGLGTFGPTGVASSMRGLGIGTAVLLASLADLRRLGYEHATIAWTEALEFYRKSCGAIAAHRFVALARRQD